MAITARNYASQAQRGLVHWAEWAAKHGNDIDAKMAMLFSTSISEAVHFVMPDDGVIIGDDLKGIVDMQVRLPYPTITVEYYATGKHSDGRDDLMDAPKRLILAQEIERKMMEIALGFALPDSSDMWIGISAACLIEGNNGQYWTPIPTGWAIPCNWCDKDGATPIMQSFLSPERSVTIPGIPLATLPNVQKAAIDRLGESAMADLVHDIAGEVSAVMELCEALMCSNVKHEPIEKIDQKKNAKRIRDGKLPIYETRMLVIDAGRTSASGGRHGDADRSGPRQHLRRGHIRRLQDGRRIWVNSCIVGAANEGRIDKSYTVRHAA